ncbi:zinc-binding dehydrogenase [Streptomyces sp. NPDC056190]|uniref:zinc-binding dehydrogenase n=1 Tax=unclassified Streptomyces TaxID=2593676 RepID=UPI0035DA9584
MGVSCFAERCVVSECSVVVIDPTIPPEIAAITGCAVVTGAGTALNVMADSVGDGAVVIGARGVGLSAVMGLRLIGAHPIVAIDTVDAKLDKALELGATHTVNARTHDLAEELAEADGVVGGRHRRTAHPGAGDRERGHRGERRSP